MATVRKRTLGEGKAAFICTSVDANGKRHARQFPRWKEADAFRREIERQLHACTFRPDGTKLSMREVCEDFLRYCEGRHRRGERMTATVWSTSAGSSAITF